MNKTVREIIHQLTEKPKTLFLIDSLGAMLTSIILFIAVLTNIHAYFGMHLKILTYLSLIAACMCIFSAICFFLLKEKRAPFIRAIGILNLLYSALTMSLIFVYYPALTIIGTTYFFVEITIVCILSYIELKVASEISKINYQITS